VAITTISAFVMCGITLVTIILFSNFFFNTVDKQHLKLFLLLWQLVVLHHTIFLMIIFKSLSNFLCSFFTAIDKQHLKLLLLLWQLVTLHHTIFLVTIIFIFFYVIFFFLLQLTNNI
jgi:hypothetical protein